MSARDLSFETFDLVVLGGGPAGQKAAIQGVKAGWRVALVERERGIGGACVHRGTIPSKTLRDDPAFAHLNFYPEDVDALLARAEKVREAVEAMLI